MTRSSIGLRLSIRLCWWLDSGCGSCVGQLAHALFRFESVFSTPLFVGFPGFVSKLWVAHDSSGTYRGVYEWDGATLAEDYVRPCGACWRWCACRVNPL